MAEAHLRNSFRRTFLFRGEFLGEICRYISMRKIVLILALSCPLAAQAKAVDAIYKKDGKAHAAQFLDAIKENIRTVLRIKLAPIVAAIRFAENGGRGVEYGVLHPKAKGKSYRTQAGWCAATVQKHWDRYIKAGGNPKDIGAFIVSLGKRYCPVGAKNDPQGLNQHWIGNVKKFQKRLESVR